MYSGRGTRVCLCTALQSPFIVQFQSRSHPKIRLNVEFIRRVKLFSFLLTTFVLHILHNEHIVECICMCVSVCMHVCARTAYVHSAFDVVASLPCRSIDYVFNRPLRFFFLFFVVCILLRALVIGNSDEPKPYS